MAAIVWIAAAVILPLVMLGDVAVGAPVSLLPASPASAITGATAMGTPQPTSQSKK